MSVGDLFPIVSCQAGDDLLFQFEIDGGKGPNVYLGMEVATFACRGILPGRKKDALVRYFVVSASSNCFFVSAEFRWTLRHIPNRGIDNI